MCGKKNQTTKSPGPVYFCIKRFFDILVSLIGIILLIPLYIIIKIAYLATGDFDKIIFCQTRIGKNGKPFKMFKFRTMCKDAEKQLITLLKNKKYQQEYEKNHKLTKDPRITKAGKLIRRTSIDELPQMINVFLGQMSIIGNRPYLLTEKSAIGSSFDAIMSVKPGITGIWQVSGRSNLSFKQRLKVEEQYAVDQSITLDAKILFSTIGIVIFGKGAK